MIMIPGGKRQGIAKERVPIEEKEPRGSLNVTCHIVAKKQTN